MESPKRITKTQLLEAIKKEVELQEKRKILETRISSINNELYSLTEGEVGENSKEIKEDINEGLFQNVGRAIGRTISGVEQVKQGIIQNFQKGVDQKKIQNLTTDIQNKQKELNDLKNQYKYLTGQQHTVQGAKKAVPTSRNKQGVVSSQKPAAAAVKKQTKAPVQQIKTPTQQAVKTAQKKSVPQVKKGTVKQPTKQIIKKIAENKKSS